MKNFPSADLDFNERLMETIKQYWVSQGFEAPETRLVSYGIIKGATVYSIRSNTINGMPRRNGGLS